MRDAGTVEILRFALDDNCELVARLVWLAGDGQVEALRFAQDDKFLRDRVPDPLFVLRVVRTGIRPAGRILLLEWSKFLDCPVKRTV
jgi:uncharacterized secreted protein with C-terminal beta-propeller domain